MRKLRYVGLAQPDTAAQAGERQRDSRTELVPVKHGQVVVEENDLKLLVEL